MQSRCNPDVINAIQMQSRCNPDAIQMHFICDQCNQYAINCAAGRGRSESNGRRPVPAPHGGNYWKVFGGWTASLL